jgi:hypothetical protein
MSVKPFIFIGFFNYKLIKYTLFAYNFKLIT